MSFTTSPQSQGTTFASPVALRGLTDDLTAAEAATSLWAGHTKRLSAKLTMPP
jgi:hypothetical protein